MPFTSVDLLKDNLGTQHVESFMAANAGVLEKLIVQADSMITYASGIQPPADPVALASGNELVRVYAAWIVAYLMHKHIGSADDEEHTRLRKDYEMAIKQCEAMRGFSGGTTYERPQADYTSTSRVGEIL